MSIAIGHIWSAITFVHSAKTILSLLRLLGKTEFRLQPFSFKIKSIFADNNIKGS